MLETARSSAGTFIWWQRGIVYQIYPRSFMDSDGDGVGDLAGIIARLDYLQWLGVDAIWISPVYPSPMKDFGYDVSDYTGVHPVFGTLADFDRLIEAVHARELKIILDFVPNHSSDQHPWFVESRSSRSNPRRDWYIWRDPGTDGGVPNNWLSCFGGSAWQFDERTGQYYYHAFLREQPDLNWRNPAVVEAMLDVLRFWLERGIDGFRVDALWHLIKDERFEDNPRNSAWREGMDPYQALIPSQTTDRPEVHNIVGRMRGLLDRYPDRVLIGEVYLPVERLVRYYGSDLRGAHLPFNFQLVLTKWDARSIARLIREYEAALPEGAWPNWVLGNHDQHRIASRVGLAQARVAAVLLLTLRGTPTLYYGDEIGMHDVPIPIDQAQDPFEKRVPGKGLGRDGERTPMQWSGDVNSGFTSGAPWLPVADDYRRANVEAERCDPKSMLYLYRRLIALRRAAPALEVGRFETVEAHGDVLAYLRRSRTEEDDFLILLNLGPRPHVVVLPVDASVGTVALTTHGDRLGARIEREVQLRGDEGLIVHLANPVRGGRKQP
jgi:alpha-glucosidase